MKVRGIIEFIVIFIIVLLLYFIFILNIDHITLSYHGKLEDYKNTYYKDSQEPNILAELSQMEGEEKEDISKEVIQKIKNNKIVKNMLKEFSGIPEKGIDKYIEQLEKDWKISYTKQHIVYIIEDDYELAFTLDMNHIIYQKTTERNLEIDWENKEITIENKYDIYKEAEKVLSKLGITEKFSFEPEAIFFNYAIKDDLDSDGYVVEDNKNQIKLNVRRPDYKIERLQIGFTESLLED